MKFASLLRGYATLLLAASVLACSNFCLPSQSAYNIHVRTMDYDQGLQFTMKTVPRGTSFSSTLREPWEAKYGSFIVVPRLLGLNAGSFAAAGMNEAGLSCDSQTLIKPWSQYPKRLHEGKDLSVMQYCTWILSNFADVDSAVAGTMSINVWAGYIDKFPIFGAEEQHFILRDRHGKGVVVEWIGGKTAVFNETLCVVTNEPTYDWHQKNVQHLEWKRGLSRSAVAVPGSFYPDERLLRIHMIKQGMPRPKSLRQAFMQAVHVLNSVTVPMGDQFGTDTGKSSGESDSGDHTQWALIYDHDNTEIYWREMSNQNWRKASLKKADLAKGSPSITLKLDANDSPWYQDETSTFTKSRNVEETAASF